MSMTVSQYASQYYNAYKLAAASNLSSSTTSAYGTTSEDVSGIIDSLDTSSSFNLNSITNLNSYVRAQYQKSTSALDSEDYTDFLSNASDFSSIYTTGKVTDTASYLLNELNLNSSDTATTAYSAYQTSISDRIGSLLDLYL